MEFLEDSPLYVGNLNLDLRVYEGVPRCMNHHAVLVDHVFDLGYGGDGHLAWLIHRHRKCWAKLEVNSAILIPHPDSCSGKLHHKRVVQRR